MNTYKKLIIAILFLAVFIGVLFVFNRNSINIQGSAGIRQESSFGYGGYATSGVISIAAGSRADVLGTSTARAFVSISTTCLQPIYLRFATTSGMDQNTATGGLVLTATSSPYEITTRNRYTGPIWASSTSACTLNVQEAKF